MDETAEIKEVLETKPSVVKVYPLVEEMTFRGIIKNESQGYALLTAIQVLVNELGTDTIIELMETVKQKPALLQKAKSYLPYLKLL